MLDPDLAFAQNVAQLAQQAGLRAQILASPRELLEGLALTGPAVLVLEAVLPELHGLEVWKQLREKNLPGLSAVFVSSLADVPFAVASIKLGASDVLVKPCAGSRLVTAIQQAFQEADARFRQQQASASAVRHVTELTPQQRRIVELLCQGYSTKKVARQLELSDKTVEYHRTRMFRKLGVTNVVQLVRLLGDAQSAKSEGEP